jgi:hypothetical protein
MKISLKLANGALLDFDGDAEEFARLQAFLAEPPEALAAASRESAPSGEHRSLVHALEATSEDEQTPGETLDARTVSEALDMTGASNDVERVTVMTFMAGQLGSEGIDYATVDRLYTELGLRKPNRFAKTFFNAKTSGLVRSSGHGRWMVTVRGENFARGHGRPPTPRPPRSARSQTVRPQLVLPEGEGGDSG